MKTKVGINSVDITWKYLLLIVGIILVIPGVFAEDLMASFAAVPSSGPAPLNVTFVDQSEGAPTFWNWDFDGVSGWESSDQNPNYTYTSPGIYNVTLVVTNSTLASYQTSRNITVSNPVLSAQFAASPRTGYAPLNVSFIDQSIGAKSWNWTFGDNFTTPDSENSAKNPLHTYTTPGWYSVNQNVSDNYTFLDGRTVNVSFENFIHVLSPSLPEADFVATPLSGPKNLTVSFIDQTPGTDNLTYIWNFGDNSLNDYTRSPIHTYTDEGSYTVSVQVTGSGGPKIVTKNNYINVGTPPNPTADFAVVPSSGVAPLSVSFIGLANGTGNKIYEWDFGDNSTHVYGRNPTHVYLTSGQFPVRLNVTDDIGGQGTVSKIPGVIVDEPVSPEINFTGSPISGDRPLNVSFSDFSTGLNASPVYQWWFGDNNLTNERLPTHLYNSTGIFDVCLTVISDGVSYSNVRPGFIQVSDQKATKARFAVTPRNGAAPLDVSFIDQSSGTEPLTYQWYFGDESVADYNKNPVHQYTKPGVYSVMLQVSGPSGSDLINLTDGITVLAPSLPSSAFSAIPLSGPVPLNVSFIDQSVGTGPFTYNWSFGDGSISYDKNPVHLYDKVGKYTVNLTTTNANGYSKSIQENYISVNPSSLQAFFTATPRNGTAPLEVSFIDQSYSEIPLSYNWDFGDGSIIGHDKNPVHIYTTDGIYTVSLQVIGENTSSIINQSNFITVKKPALQTADFTAVPVSGAVPLLVSFVDQSVGAGPFTYLWDFGDGSGQVSDKNPSHTYETPGVYTVNETVSSPVGPMLVTKSNLINATISDDSQITIANFSAVLTRGVAPFNVQFIDLSSGPVAAWKWTFGDGSSVTEQGPNHTYINPGVYDVSLDVFNKSGVSNTTTSPKFISALSPTVTPKIALVYADLSNRKKIQFFDHSEGVGINSWIWDFGDGSEMSTIQNPLHEYTKTGKYAINLTISNGYAKDNNVFYIKIQ